MLESENAQPLVRFDAEVSENLPQLSICLGLVNNIRVEKDNERVQRLKKTVYEEVRRKYNIETLKDDPTVRSYRDLYWRLNIDPTKIRPSGEALLRRVLHGSDLPSISTVVDAYNLASMKTTIPVSGFDKDRINPPICIRFAKDGETFTGIGMNKSVILTKRMLVLADEKQIVCIYPHRDSDYTKITEQTTSALIIGYGAPGVPEKQLKEAVETTLSYVNQVSDGEIETVSVFRE